MTSPFSATRHSWLGNNASLALLTGSRTLLSHTFGNLQFVLPVPPTGPLQSPRQPNFVCFPLPLDLYPLAAKSMTSLSVFANSALHRKIKREILSEAFSRIWPCFFAALAILVNCKNAAERLWLGTACARSTARTTASMASRSSSPDIPSAPGMIGPCSTSCSRLAAALEPKNHGKQTCNVNQ